MVADTSGKLVGETLSFALARRTLVQRAAFAPARAGEQALELLPGVRELATGFQVESADVSRALATQQADMANSIEELFRDDAEMSLACEQMRVKSGQQPVSEAVDRPRLG